MRGTHKLEREEVRLVRIWKRARQRGIHFLEIGQVRTIEIMKTREGSSLPGEGRHQDWSGHRKKASQQGALTN